MYKYKPFKKIRFITHIDVKDSGYSNGHLYRATFMTVSRSQVSFTRTGMSAMAAFGSHRG